MFLHPAGIYLLKVNNRNTRTRCEICSKLTIKTPERRFQCSLLIPLKTSENQRFSDIFRGIKREHWKRRSGVFIVIFEHISHLVLVFLLLTLNMQLPARHVIPVRIIVPCLYRGSGMFLFGILFSHL